jgi:hypothetical protein
MNDTSRLFKHNEITYASVVAEEAHTRVAAMHQRHDNDVSLHYTHVLAYRYIIMQYKSKLR